jgi:hypothetical protein
MRSRPVAGYPSLTRGPVGWRWLVTAMATLTMVAVGALWMPTAVARDCPPPLEPILVPLPDGLGYEIQCQHPGGGGGGDDGSDDDSGGGDGGGSSEPTCDLRPPATYCEGTAACYLQEAHPPWALPPDPKPSEDAQWMVETCMYEDGSTVSVPVWHDPGEPPAPPPPPLEEIAAMAYGELLAPEFSLSFSPENLTFVGTDTYFWVEGLDGGNIEGTPAFGLIAVGVPKHIRITPGDGSSPFTCPPWPASRVDECAWTYLETSADSGITGPGGRPAFQAQAVLVYDIHFEFLSNPGVAVDIPNLAAGLDTLETDPSTAAVPVGEIQALNR